MGMFDDKIEDLRKRSRSKSSNPDVSGRGNQMTSRIASAIKDKALNSKMARNMRSKNENMQNKIKQMIVRFQKMLPTIINVCYVIGAILLLVNVIYFVYPIASAFGSSAHYYCDINASNEIKSSALYQQYCGGKSANNESIAEAAITLATVDEALVPGGKINYSGPGTGDLEPYVGASGYTAETFISVAPQLVSLIDGDTTRTSNKWGASYYASCDLTVALAVVWSGADYNIPTYLKNQYPYYQQHPELYQELNSGDPVQPGDIAIQCDGGDPKHTYIYVANWENGTWTDNSLVQEKYPGSSSNRFEGSHQDYYAKLGIDGSPWASDGSVRIWRYIGDIETDNIYTQVSPN